MKQRASLGWGSLLALVLLGLVPGGHPTRDAADRALAQGARERAPLGTTPTGLGRPDVLPDSLRPNHTSGAALPTRAPSIAGRYLPVTRTAAAAAEPGRPARVAFPYFPTGPPQSS